MQDHVLKVVENTVIDGSLTWARGRPCKDSAQYWSRSELFISIFKCLPFF